MMPDIGRHLELLAVILALILGKCVRVHLRKRNVSLLLTVSDTEQHSSESLPNTRINAADGRKTDLSEPRKQHTRRPESDE